MIRILIVEDSEEERYLLQTLLQGSGYQVTLAANGAEALEAARADPPDIVVSDIMMPVMDGFQLCREWKKDERLRAIPFVFYTAAYTSPQDQEFALSLGADYFITKSTEWSIFMEMLHEIIGEYEAGALVSSREPTVGEEPIYLREYSERLVRKLEEKVAELERANKHLAVLHAIAATVSRSLELDTVLQDALQHVLGMMKLEAGLVMLINEQVGTARLVAHQGLSPAIIEGMDGIDLSSVALGDLAEQVDAPLIVEDVAKAPRLAQMIMRAEGLRSYVSIPLQAKGRLFGVISAFTHSLSSLRSVDVQLLSDIGDQVGVAIENAQLFAEAQRRVDELVFLNEIGQILSSTLKLEQVLTILMDQTTSILDAEAGSVSLLDEESGVLDFMVASGPEADKVKGLKLPLGQGIAGWSVREGQPALVPDVRMDARFCAEVDQKTGFVTRSLLCVPLIAKDKVIGVIEVLNKRMGTFSEYDLSLLSSLATVAATALENARLYERVRAFSEELEKRVEERTSELLTLHTIAATVSQSLDLRAIVNRSLEQVLALMGRRAGRFYLLDSRTDQLHLVAYKGLSEELAQAVAQYEVGQGLMGLVASRGEPIVVEDVFTDPRTVVQEIKVLDLRSLAAVPLQAAGRVVGVMSIGDFQKRPFIQEDMTLLVAIGQQIGVAVENARLYARMIEEKSRMELLYDIGRRLNASLNLGEVLRDSLSLLTSWLGVQWGSILFTDPDLAKYNTLTMETVPEGVFRSDQGVAEQGLAGWVMERGEGTIVFDTQKDERWLVCSGEEQLVRSAICLPLKERGRVVGVLTLAHSEPGYFNEEHRELLNSIVGQVSSTVERMRLYEEMVQSRERLDAIFRSVGDALFVTDPDGTILYVNDAFQKLTGYHFDDAIGRNPRFLQSGRTPSETYHELWDTILAGRVWRGELVNRRKDGTLYDADLTVAPVVGNEGNIVNFIGSQRDITPLKEVGRMKDELISTVSHELRTPMSSVLGFSELLLTRRLGEEKRRLYTETIHKEAKRLSTLINDFLDIQRMEARRQEYHLESLSLPEIISAVQATLITQSKKHSVVMDIPEKLPLVKADRYGISQVLNNLLSNAIKFSPQGGEVRISCMAVEVEGQTMTFLTSESQALSPESVGDGRWVVVSVSDEGLGIPKEAIPHLFGKFFRVDSSDRREIKGTGLGLAICKDVIEAHGGRIWAESEEGVGSTFWFTLPSQ